MSNCKELLSFLTQFLSWQNDKGRTVPSHSTTNERSLREKLQKRKRKLF